MAFSDLTKKQKGLVKTYAQVCETTWGKESMLSEEEEKEFHKHCSSIINEIV